MGKLRLWPLIRRSYRFTFDNHDLLFHAGWPWMVVVVVCQLPSLVHPGTPGKELLSSLAMAVAGAAFATVWHRRILLDESPPGWLAVRFGRREIQYLGLGLVLSLGVIVPLVGLALLVSALHLPGGIAAWAMIGVAFVGGAVVNRLILVFPAVAIDDKETTLRQSWHLTRGNTFRLIAGAVLSFLPLSIVSSALSIIAAKLMVAPVISTRGLGVGVESMAIIVVFYEIAIGAGFMAFTYEDLIRPDGTGEHDASHRPDSTPPAELVQDDGVEGIPP
ncbi:MAG: hypothetical protein HQL37_07690 [Alphaproteobacteria bacterium]|nr:hypothetical protein [Alphaproteobacteria bacterium]